MKMKAKKCAVGGFFRDKIDLTLLKPKKSNFRQRSPAKWPNPAAKTRKRHANVAWGHADAPQTGTLELGAGAIGGSGAVANSLSLTQPGKIRSATGILSGPQCLTLRSPWQR